MPIYSDFPIRLVDVSQAQDDPTTEYKPTLAKLLAAGIRGIIIRVGFGRVIDGAFAWFWNLARGFFERKPYWYGDYYSHRNTSKTDEQWGEEQANVCYNALKPDLGEMPLAWDAEASTYGGELTEAIKPSYNRILRAFRATWKRLSGKDIELYAALKFLPFFDDDMKDMNLYLAWWNSTVTLQMIKDELAKVGWRGKVVIWQMTSSGDINNDGIPDGLTLGMESAGLDLDVFLGTEEEYKVYCGGNVITNPVETTFTELFKAKCISSVGLTTRNAPNIYGADLNRDLAFNEIVSVYAIENGWYRIDPVIQRWCSGSASYMQKIEPVIEPPVVIPSVTFTAEDKAHLDALWLRFTMEHPTSANIA